MLINEFILNGQVVTINTLNRLGAKVNIDQQQLILPCKINLDIEPQSLRIITLKRGMVFCWRKESPFFFLRRRRQN